ncbi:hypothetical protein EUGRSUZ_J01496 [Eucalyptus grandis]|uniref:Uncharacterized protein n=2 Tax=Eucalyptus grandis TaxID=71139 RepID=A0ACC3J5M8_EUCGR|nr:hypothetical protein EUGRSUZ_J01496 [Eucalyptus grandis]
MLEELLEISGIGGFNDKDAGEAGIGVLRDTAPSLKRRRGGWLEDRSDEVIIRAGVVALMNEDPDNDGDVHGEEKDDRDDKDEEAATSSLCGRLAPPPHPPCHSP